MVKSRKSLLFILLLFILSNSFVFAKENDSETSSQSTEISSDSGYFSDYYNNSSAENLSSSRRTTSATGYLVRVIIVLIIVVALIYGVLWFVKNKTNVVNSEDDYLRKTAFLDVAPGKSVAVITLLDKGYLIGITDSEITLLGEIDDKELISSMNVNADSKQNTKKPVNFSEVLEMLTNKGPKSKNVFSSTEDKLDSMLKK